ncbi:MAG: sigma-54 dependent transcriptional regulator [Myxococcota bacterium]
MALHHHHVGNRVLIVDDESSLRTVLSALLRKEGFDITAVGSAQEALDVLQNSQNSAQAEPFDVLIADLRMPEMDGMQLLQKTAQQYPDLPVIILTAHGTVDTAVQALKEGAFDFLTKPYEREEIALVLRKAIAQRSKSLGKTSSSHTSQQQLLIGSSSQMQAVQDMIKRAANTLATVLIMGEPGTGKELVAQALHKGSSRCDKPFICMNCAAIPAQLLEYELFGYPAGVPAAASAGKPGRFELAQGGTLLLDEVGHLPVNVQAKLLRVLQDSQFESTNNMQPAPIDVRLIASTNQNLQHAIMQKKFREDFYYRLNVVPIQLPPLRDRPQDIPELVQHFTKKYSARFGKQIDSFTPQAMHLLQAHDWPGNVREVENVIERTLLFADTNCIAVDDLPPEIVAQIQLDNPAETAEAKSGAFIPMKSIVRKKTAQIERVLIETALQETGGNVTHAAQKLKISRKGLQLKMKELGLRDSTSRNSFSI